MASEYRVGASLELLGVASGLTALTGLARAMQGMQSRVLGLNRSLQQTRISALAAGGALMGIGAGITFGLVRAADAVAKIQDNLNRVAISARMSSREVQTLFEQARTVGLRESLGPLEISEFMRGLAQVGIPSAALRSLVSDPGILASARLLQVYGKVPTMFQAGVELAAIPHMLQQYGTTPQSTALIKSLIQEVVAAETISPASLQAIIRQASYVLPTTGILNVKPQDVYAMLIANLWATGGMGGGSRGGLSGAAAQAFLTRSFPGVFGGGLLTGQSGVALAALGLLKPDLVRSALFTGGQFDVFKEIQLAQRARTMAQTPQGRTEMIQRGLAVAQAEGNIAAQKYFLPLLSVAKDLDPGQLLVQLFSRAFGVTGARIAAFVSSPAYEQALGFIGAQRRAVDPAEVIRQRQQTVYVEQVKQLNAALENLQYDLGQQVLPALQAVVATLDRFTVGLNTFAQAHPTMVKVVAEVAAVTAGLTTLGGALLILRGALLGFSLLALPGGAIALGVLALGALGLYIASNWGIIVAKTRSLAEQFQIAFNLAFRHIQQFLHDITFGLVPGPARVGGGYSLYGGSRSIVPPGMTLPPGIVAIPGLGGGIFYGVAGPGGVVAGPSFATPGEAQQYAITHPAGGLGRGKGGLQGLVINGGIHVSIQGHPDDPRTTDRMVSALVGTLRRAGIGVSTGGGTQESPFVFGGAPA